DLIFMAHIILFFLIPRENAEFTDIGTKKTIQHYVTEGTRSTGNHEGLTRKNAHSFLIYSCYMTVSSGSIQPQYTRESAPNLIYSFRNISHTTPQKGVGPYEDWSTA